mmetsp:Transcript_18607/g.61133  ORF Transcript_18607/g.61133 Transcript_18607/m.61133 type:complete len:290 (+) Transcript_18607:515-1384(+)
MRFHSMGLREFSTRLRLQPHDCYRALNTFKQCSNKKGHLMPAKFARMLGWPSERNLVLNRVISCFDNDKDGNLDLREFMIFYKMHCESVSPVDVMRYWWWLALFTDEKFLLSDKSAKFVEKDFAMIACDQSDTRSGIDNVQVPVRTVARLIRDVLSSCHGMHIRGAIEYSQFITRPAPSKIYIKVLKNIRAHSTLDLDGLLSFEDFFTLCHTEHPPFMKIFFNLFLDVHHLLLGGHVPKNPTSFDLFELRCFFDGKMGEYVDGCIQLKEKRREIRMEQELMDMQWVHES